MGKDLKGKELGTGISQLKDGRYRGRYTNRFGRRMPPIYSWDLKEVKERLLKAKYEDKLGKDELPHEGVTVEEVYNLWIKRKQREVRTTTIALHKYHYKKDISKYKFYKITDINQKVVEEFMDGLIDRGLKLGTIKNVRTTFWGIMDFAVEKHMCINNPFQNYKIPKSLQDEAKKREALRKETKFLNEEQRNLFLKYINEAPRCHLRSFYEFSMSSGLRYGESAALKWEHVDFENKTVFVQDGYSSYTDEKGIHTTYDGLTKTPTSTRKIPLSATAYEILLMERGKRKEGVKPSELIFLNTRGEPLSYQCVKQSLRSLSKSIQKKYPESNFPTISPHWFRHTFATICLEHEINIKAVQHYLGHASLGITADLYSHVADDWTYKEIQKFR